MKRRPQKMGTKSALKDVETYELPAVVAVALQTERPEVLRALADEAADKFKDLDESKKTLMVRELFRLIASILEDLKAAKKKVEAYQEVTSILDGLKDEIENTLDDVNERMSAL